MKKNKAINIYFVSKDFIEFIQKQIKDTIDLGEGTSPKLASNDKATRSRSIYPITQNILRADISNHSLILLQATEYYKRALEMNPY